MMKGREGAASGSLNKEGGGGDKGIRGERAGTKRLSERVFKLAEEPASAKDTVSV